MPTFRLLVFANATVTNNQKLSCVASTMRELEGAVQAELGLGFPVWIFMRDPDFGNDFVKVTHLSDMAGTAKIEVRPAIAGGGFGGGSPAPAAEPAAEANGASRKFMLLIAANEFVRSTKKVVGIASTLSELSDHVMAELGLGLDAGILTKPGASADVSEKILTLSQVKDKDKLMVWPRPRPAVAPAPAPVRAVAAPAPAALSLSLEPKEFTLLLCKSELVGATNKHFKDTAATLEELVEKVAAELGCAETPVLCLHDAGGARGAAITSLADLPAKAKVQVVSQATINPDVLTVARAAVAKAAPVRAAGVVRRIPAASAVITAAKPTGPKRDFVLLVGANDLIPSSKRADVKAASVEELEAELQKQFMLGTKPIMVVKHGQTARLTDLADLPAKAKVQIQKAGGPVRVTSMASVVSTATVAKRVAGKAGAVRVVATSPRVVAGSPRVVTAGSPRVTTAVVKKATVAVVKKKTITLMIIPNKLVPTKQRLDLTNVKDIANLTAQVAKSVGEDPAGVFVAELVDDPKDAKPFANLAEVGTRAKVQVWSNNPDPDPADAEEESDDEVELIPGTDWTELHDDDGTPYYYNVETEETVWDEPAEVKAARGPSGK